MGIGSLISNVGISIEKDVSRFARRAGVEPLAWPAGAQTESIIYRLPTDPTERASIFSREQSIVVSEGEVAMVLRDGTSIGALEPGRYRCEKQRVVGALDVVWMRTGQRTLKWGVGNVTASDGVEVGASGTMRVRVADPEVFYAEMVHSKLLLSDKDLQKELMPAVQAVLRTFLARSTALALQVEREAFTEAVSNSAWERLEAFGMSLHGFEVVQVHLPPEFRDAVASRAMAQARSGGELVDAQTKAQILEIEAAAKARAELLAGTAKAEVLGMLSKQGVDPLALKAIEALESYAETPSTGGLLTGDTAKANLFGAIAGAAMNRPSPTPEDGAQAPQPPLSLPDSTAPPSTPQPPEAAAGLEGAGPESVESIQRQIDGLTERLASGELSETLYMKLTSRLEERLAELGGGGAG